MKTNTFIFNFINPSRLVHKNPPPSPEHSTVAPSGTAPEAPAVEEKSEQAVQRAEGATLDEANRVYISASISNLKLLSIPDAKQKVEKANAKLNRKLARMEEIDKLRSSGNLTYVDQKEYERLVKEKQSASKAVEQLQASLAEKTSELARLEDQLSKKASKPDYTNPYAGKSSEKKREIVKADPETKKKITVLLSNPSDELKAFVNADHTGKNWKDLNNEFLAVLGASGASKGHVKALQEILFGENEKDIRATDGKLGNYTLARLQNKLGVMPAVIPEEIYYRNEETGAIASFASDKDVPKDEGWIKVEASGMETKMMSDNEIALMEMEEGAEYQDESLVGVKRAREHYKKGKELYENGQYTQALKEFETAYKAKPNPRVLRSIAETKLQMRDMHGAMLAFEEFLKNPGDASNEAISKSEYKFAWLKNMENNQQSRKPEDAVASHWQSMPSQPTESRMAAPENQEETAIAYNAEIIPGAYWNPKTGEGMSFADVNAIPEGWVPVNKSGKTQVASAKPKKDGKAQG